MTNIEHLRQSIEDRITMVPEAGCHIWIGSWDTYGYGSVHSYGVNIRASRASWMVYRGPIPEGLCVMHKCDTPACVNPDHLSLGTHKENMEDMVRKGRSGGPEKKPNCKRGHPLRGENLYLIRRKTGRIVRDCRECRRQAVKRRNERRSTF